MSPFEFIILALASYGVSLLLTDYDGPRQAFIKLRSKYPNSALKCAVCTSVYVSVAFLVLGLLGLYVLAIPFAIVGIVVILESL